jgi:hypothetical protein
MAQGSVVLLCKDLLFTSRIKDVAKQCGRTVQLIRSEESLRVVADTLGTEGGGGVLLVDLEKPSVVLDVIESVLTCFSEAGWSVVGFYSHVHVDVAQKAKAMGFGAVMPRSKFVQILPELVS